MKKVAKIVLLAILAMILLFLVLALLVPNEFQVEESIIINVPKSKTLNYMADFNNYHEWNPWQDRDAEIKVIIAGSSGEVGSTYRWSGNKDAGKGIMEIRSITNNQVDIDLRFIEPWETESFTQYRFEVTEGGTRVYWSMKGSMPYPMNIMNLFSVMDNAIAKEYRKGLEAVKDILENRHHLQVGVFKIEQIAMPLTNFFGIKGNIPFDAMHIFFSESYEKIFAHLTAANAEILGPPTSLYFVWNEEDLRTELAAVVAVPAHFSIKEMGEFENWELGGNALKIAYYGNYDQLEKAHGALHEQLENMNLMPKSPAIEEYAIGPPNESDTSKWLTNIYYLIEQ